MKLCKELPIIASNKNLSIIDNIKNSFQFFMEKFIVETKYYLGKPIRWKNDVDYKDYGEYLKDYNGYTFCHIVTKEIPKDIHHKRELDIDRLNNLPYLDFFINQINDVNNNCLQCQNFLILREPNKRYIRHFIYCKNSKYLIILQEHTMEFIVVSAFQVDGIYHNGLIKRYYKYR